MLDISYLRSAMPKVGDVLYKHCGTLRGEQGNTLVKDTNLRKCRVIYVNRRHLWYRVEFDINGFKVRECFKVPEL